MTRDEATQIIEIFLAANPKVKLNPAGVEIWFEAALEHTDFDLGRRVAIDLVADPNCPSFPTPAQFNQTKRRMLDRERLRGAPKPESWDPLPREKAKSQFAGLRDALTKSAEHVCGPECPHPDPIEIPEEQF